MMVFGLYSITAVEAVAAPYIPTGHVIWYLYILDVAGRFVHIGMAYTLVAAVLEHHGPYLLDMQLELAPIAL